MSTVYSGLCRGGPLDGKSKALQDMRKFTPPAGNGFYVHEAGKDTRPPGWRWIENTVRPTGPGDRWDDVSGDAD